MPPASPRFSLALALLALAACTPAPAAGPSAARPKPNAPRPSAGATPFTPSGEPPVVGPSVAPLASPATSPGPLPSPDAAATFTTKAALPVRAQVELVARLAYLSQRSYLQAQGQLISDQGGGIVSNHSSGLLVNAAAQLLAKAGGGIVSNHSSGLIGPQGGGIISNHGGGLLSNNGGGYRLAQAPTPEVAIANAPKAGEVLRQSRLWQVGGGRVWFQQGDSADRRSVDLHPSGQWPFRESDNRIAATHPNGAKAIVEGQETLLADDGSLRQRTGYRTRFDQASGLPFAAELIATPASFRYQELGDLRQEAHRYELNAQTGSGAFTLKDLNGRTTLTGTLSQVALSATQRLHLALGDPLAYYPGSMTVTGDEGAVLYRKTRRNEGGAIFQDFDLGQGTVLKLRMTSPSEGQGTVEHEGQPVGVAALRIQSNGGLFFNLRLGPDPELVVGYGPPDQGEPPPAPLRAAYVVSTPLGAEQGDVAGDASVARFRSLRGIVADPSVPTRWYATDYLAQRVLQIDANPWRVARVAGTGSPGDADGAGGSAAFRGPLGIAVGPDGSLYVADNEAHRIRRVRLQGGAWVVDTIAGANASGWVDGPGSEARFKNPNHLAVSGQSLFVADQGNHRIRRVRLDQAGFPVDTVAGSGVVAATDGPLLTAAIGLPLGLVAQGQVLHTFSGPMLRRIDLGSGQVTSVSGTVPSEAFFLRDGAKGEAGLLQPSALMPLSDGAFLAGGPYDLRAIRADGSIRSVAGSDGLGRNDGEHDQASFHRIFGLAPAGNGAVLATECPDPEATAASLPISRLRLIRYRPKG